MAEPTISSSALQQFRSLLDVLREAQARADEHAKATHERFNVFTTLLEAHDEVRLHTRFLCCLLDPEGYHDCGSLFLDLFLETIEKIPGLTNDKAKEALLALPDCKQPWTVTNESPQGEFGRIDLLLEQKQPRFGIAIENKIYAGEQPKQIERYAKFLASRFGHSDWRVIYLTLHGEESETGEGQPYIRISYAKHILAWLDKCLEKTYHIVPINQVILQYREVVRSLTGNIEPVYMKPIADFITQNPDLIRFRKQLDEGINEACASYFERLANEIEKGLRNDFQVRLYGPERFGFGEYDKLIITTQNMPFEICLEDDRCEKHVADRILALGIFVDPKKTPLSTEAKDILKQMYNLLKTDADAEGIDQHKPNDLWPTGWRNIIENLDDAGLAKLIKTPVSETASKICDDIRSYVKQLQEVYSKAASKK